MSNNENDQKTNLIMEIEKLNKINEDIKFKITNSIFPQLTNRFTNKKPNLKINNSNHIKKLKMNQTTFKSVSITPNQQLSNRDDNKMLSTRYLSPNQSRKLFTITNPVNSLDTSLISYRKITPERNIKTYEKPKRKLGERI